MAEETSQIKTTDIDINKPFWAVDPIDGTVNFINGLDIFCISVGLCQESQFMLGAVAFPRSQKLYCTIGSDDAFLNGKPLQYHPRNIDEALIAVSFSGKKVDTTKRNKEYQLFGEINDISRGCTRFGSAAANICFTASGELQAAYGFNAKMIISASATATELF